MHIVLIAFGTVLRNQTLFTGDFDMNIRRVAVCFIKGEIFVLGQ